MLCTATIRALALLSLLAASPLAAQVRVCVEVDDQVDASAGLDALVRAEVDAHPTHVAGSGECEQHLRIESFELADSHYLTGRLDALVPERLEVEDGELEAAVVELVRVLLHNDPLRLDRPGSDEGLAGALQRLRRAPNAWGIQLDERVGVFDGDVAALPGIAIHMRRELLRWSVGIVFGLSGRLTPPPQTLHLRLVAHVALDTRWATNRDADAAGLFGFRVGLMHIWAQGPRRDLPSAQDAAFGTGPFVGVMSGVELFRTTTTRLSLTLAIDVPLFLVRDDTDAVTRSWLPTAVVAAALVL